MHVVTSKINVQVNKVTIDKHVQIHANAMPSCLGVGRGPGARAAAGALLDSGPGDSRFNSHSFLFLRIVMI